MQKIKNFFDFKNYQSEAAISLALVVSLFFGGIASYAYAVTQTQQVTLSVTVNQALTFTLATNNFTSINPGTITFATSTLYVVTNDTNGYTVSLSGDQKNSQPQNNLQLNGATSTQIADAVEWIPNAATGTPGNAVRISSLPNTGNVLAFRVMSASSTNGAGFLSTAWWGTQDNYTDNANTLWGGIASSTVQRVIGNLGTNSYFNGTHTNTVLYYLNVSPSQTTGLYNAPITYTAVSQ